MTFDIYFWITLANIVLCVALLGWTVQAVWHLWDQAHSSSGMTSHDRLHWLRHPWRYRSTRSVLLRSLLLTVVTLALFVSPVWRHAPAPNTTTNKGAVEQIKATAAEPTRKQIKQRTVQEDKRRTKENNKAVDSPGIHYRPTKIDPEQHIKDILKRTNQRKGQDTK